MNSLDFYLLSRILSVEWNLAAVEKPSDVYSEIAARYDALTTFSECLCNIIFVVLRHILGPIVMLPKTMSFGALTNMYRVA